MMELEQPFPAAQGVLQPHWVGAQYLGNKVLQQIILYLQQLHVPRLQ